MKLAIVALALAAQLVPMNASPAIPEPVACYDLGIDSGCLYVIDGREVPVQHEYAHCLPAIVANEPQVKVWEDGSAIC